MRGWVFAICLALVHGSGLGQARSAQPPTEAERAASLVVRWQQIIYPAFEDARASIDEENSDHLNALLSQGAVRAVRDRADAAGLAKADVAASRLAASLVKAAIRQPGGSLIIDSDAFEKGLDAVCPLYPFCDR